MIGLSENELDVWEDLKPHFPPVPREIVAETPFDAHVGASERRKLRKLAKANPSAGSGHYGKELNLMLAGHKRVALIGREDMHPWAQHIWDGRFIAVVDGTVDLFFIMQREDHWLLELIIEANCSPFTTGVVLGYQPEDALECHNKMCALTVEWATEEMRERGIEPPANT